MRLQEYESRDFTCPDLWRLVDHIISLSGAQVRKTGGIQSLSGAAQILTPAASKLMLQLAEVVGSCWETGYAPALVAELRVVPKLEDPQDGPQQQQQPRSNYSKGAPAAAVMVPSTIASELRHRPWLPSHAGALLPAQQMLLRKTE
jgi:hypothetical protein